MSDVTFAKNDFDIFLIEGLDERMNAIRKQIQPKFKEIGRLLAPELASQLNEETIPVHIAQHLRRTKHAPESTWMAFCGTNRGYKKYPHFQLGLYQSHLFIWLAFMDNPQHEKQMAESFIKKPGYLEQLPDDYVVSLDHTVEKVTPIKELDLKKALTRWKNVKKGEFLIGRQVLAEDPLLSDPENFRHYLLETYRSLIPLYQQAFAAYPEN